LAADANFSLIADLFPLAPDIAAPTQLLNDRSLDDVAIVVAPLT
jgi:hypothetical protein